MLQYYNAPFWKKKLCQYDKTQIYIEEIRDNPLSWKLSLDTLATYIHVIRNLIDQFKINPR